MIVFQAIREKPYNSLEREEEILTHLSKKSKVNLFHAHIYLFLSRLLKMLMVVV